MKMDFSYDISENWRSVLLALMLLSIVLIVLSTRLRYDYWRKRGFPEVSTKAIPVFGHTFKLLIGRKSISDTFAEFYDDCGENRFAGFFQGKTPCLLVKDPVLIRNILAADFPIFVDRAFAGEGGDPTEAKQLFHLQGRKWKDMRTRLTPMFSSARMETMFPLMKACAEEMLEALRKETDEGEGLVDIQLQKMPPELLLKLPIRLAPDKAWDFLCNLARESIEKKEEILKQEREKGIRRGRTQRNETGDFMDALVALKFAEDGHPAGNISLDDLTAQTMQFFSMGYETTVSLLTSALFELSSSKEGIEIQRKLRKEIMEASISDGGNITYGSLGKMELLNGVLSETLRLHPPTAVLVRNCNAQYWIPDTNLSLEKGSRIFIPVHSLHMDPKYFPDPGRFDPDRFLPEQTEKRPNYVYLPFGGGPRHCIGLRFAFLQAQLGLSSLLFKFDFEFHNKKSNFSVRFPSHFPFLKPKRGIRLEVRQRRKQFRRHACSQEDLEQEFNKLQQK